MIAFSFPIAPSGCRACLAVAVIGLMLAFTARGAEAQTCTPDPDSPNWICDVNQGLLWFQETPASTPDAGTEGDHLGISAAGWGDFNGDGYNDILFGGYQNKFEDIWGDHCPFPEPEPLRHDKAWIVLGGASLPCSQSPCQPNPCSPQPCMQPPCNQLLCSVVIELRDYSMAGRNDRLGWRVAFLGDIDGHAGDEIAVSAIGSDLPSGPSTTPDARTVYVISYRGGLPTAPDSADPETGIPGSKVLRIRAQAANDWLGFGLARGGQIIGDATSDLLIGAPNGPKSGDNGDVPDHSGRVYVVDGAKLAEQFNETAGDPPVEVLPVGGVADFMLTPGTNCVRLKGNDDSTEGDIGMRFGYSVCAIGDIYGDGRNEFAAGAIESWYDCAAFGGAGGLVSLPAPKGKGRVRIFTPGSSYSAVQIDEVEGVARGDWFGYALASGVDSPIGTVPGDANGDEQPDLLIGAPLSDGNSMAAIADTGSAYLYSGADLDDGGSESPLETIHGTDPEEYAGWAVALGGKLNQDELAEFAVASRDFDVSIPLLPGTEPFCMGAVEATGLFERNGLKAGRVRVYCGSPSAPYPPLAEIQGIQTRAHIYTVVWLPNMENFPHDSTELLFTTPAFAGCVGELSPENPYGCTPMGGYDSRREIGRAYIRLFH